MSREEKIFKKQLTYQKKNLACFSSVKCLLRKHLTVDNLFKEARGGGEVCVNTTKKTQAWNH